MATTRTISGSLSLVATLQAALSGDYTGGPRGSIDISKIFDASNIVITGFLKGTITAAAGDLLLAHATDPFQGMGDATYSDGFTVAGTKLKCLVIWNKDTTNTVSVTRKAGNPLPVFMADGDGVTIQPGGFLALLFPTGTAALTTGTNDGLVVAVGGGTPSCEILAAYGT